MQNAKCKMDEAFCSAKASLMVTCGNLHPKNSFSHEGYLLFAFCVDPLPRSPILHFAFCVLHFGRSPTNPNLKTAYRR